jgi:hypothetical protein
LVAAKTESELPKMREPPPERNETASGSKNGQSFLSSCVGNEVAPGVQCVRDIM